MESPELTPMSKTGNGPAFRRLLTYGIIILVCIVLAIFLVLYIQYTAGTNTKTSGMEDFSNVSTTPTAVVTTSPTSQNSDLKITSPTENELMGATLTIAGEMKGFFEGVLNYRVIDNLGNILIESNIVTEDQLETFKPFEQTISLPVTSATSGKLEFFKTSAKDGTESVVTTINIKF